MPFQIGSVGLHDDISHYGSAKRDAVNGVAPIDNLGNVLAKGPAIYLTRDGAEALYIRDRITGEDVLGISRSGANNYVGYILETTGWKKIQMESMKNVASGIAGLDASSRVAQTNSFLAAPSLGTGKAKDTEYQAGARPRLVTISLYCNIGSTGTSIAAAELATRATTGVTVENPIPLGINTGSAAMTANTNVTVVITRIIPTNWFYILTSMISGTGSISVIAWDEVDL